MSWSLLVLNVAIASSFLNPQATKNGVVANLDEGVPIASLLPGIPIPKERKRESEQVAGEAHGNAHIRSAVKCRALEKRQQKASWKNSYPLFTGPFQFQRQSMSLERFDSGFFAYILMQGVLRHVKTTWGTTLLVYLMKYDSMNYERVLGLALCDIILKGVLLSRSEIERFRSQSSRLAQLLMIILKLDSVLFYFLVAEWMPWSYFNMLKMILLEAFIRFLIECLII